MSVFGTEELSSLARANPARPPVTLAESLESGYNTMDSSLTTRSLLYNRFESIRNEAESAFGERFWNPGDFSHTSELNDRTEEAFFKELNRRRERLPDPRTFPNYTSESMRRDIAEERTRDRQERASISEREGTLGAIAAGIGSFGGAAADPILLSSLLIGAPWATGVIRTAMIEAGIGLAVEVPIQAAIQVGRQQFGEAPDIGEAATNVLIAGLGAGVFAGGIKAIIAGGKRLISSGRASQEVRDATDNLVDLEASMKDNPFPDTRGGRTAHVSRLEEAMVRAHGGTVRAAYLADTAIGRVKVGGLPGRVVIEPFNVDPAVKVTKIRPTVLADFPDNAIKAHISLSKFVQKALKEIETDERQFIPGDKGLRETFTNKDVTELDVVDIRPVDRAGEKVRAQVGAERWDGIVRAIEAEEAGPSIHVTDAATGESKSFSMRALADDIAEDEAITRELATCVTAGVVT